MTRVEDHALLSWPQRHPVIYFLIMANVITVAFAFLAWSPVVGLSGAPKVFFSYAAKFGPSLGAIVAAAVIGGRAEVGALLLPLLRWRVSPVWYLLAVGGPMLLTAISVVIAGTSSGASLAPTLTAPLLVLAAFVRPIVLGGGLGEEIGWRGFMLPRLQQRYGPIRASLAIGLFWGLWHSPAFFIAGSGKTGGVGGIVMFVVLCTIMSLVFTWVFNASGGDLLIVVLLHGCVNGSLDAADLLFPAIKPDLVWAVGMLAIAVVAMWSMRKAGLPESLRD